MGVLEDILRGVRADLAQRKAELPEAALAERAAAATPPPSLLEALQAGEGPRVVAEIKRSSPSRGPIRPDLDPVAVARSYAAAGAAAISVLTEPRRFGGSLDDLARVAAAVELPVLRKDFIIERYQLLEARAAGAAAVLLIVRILSDDELAALLEAAHALGLDALCEVHTEAEAARLHLLQPSIVGVNCRDLDTLEVSLETARRLSFCLPGAAVRVAESGLRRPGDIASLEAFGYRGFLIGEHLMQSPDPGAALAELLVDPSAPPAELDAGERAGREAAP